MKLPDSYADWRECITVRCGISLTPVYVERRLAELQDKDTAETKCFTELYGDAHLRRVLTWFGQAKRDLRVGV